MGYFSTCVAALFAGTVAGKKLLARSRDVKEQH